MANVTLLVGESGTGKSTSIKNLDPKITYLINGAGKPLPFKGSELMYKVGTNLTQSYSAPEIVGVLDAIDKQALHIKNVVIDDSGFVMTEMFFAKAQETGYTKFTQLAQAYQSILAKAKSMRSDLNICIIMHEENEVSNGIIVGKKQKTIGKLLDDQYNPLSVVTVALFTSVDYDKEGNPTYEFITNRCKKDGIVIPAKSPAGMFDKLRIPNDLALVFTKEREYYN
jgi:hypothetical protein